MRSMTLTVMLALACGDEPDDAEPQTGTAAADDGTGSSTAAPTDDDGSTSAGADETTQAGESTAAEATTTGEPSTESSAGSSSSADAETSAGDDESDGGGVQCSPADPCHDGETCVFPMGDCGADGTGGMCIPNKMPCDATFLPVCGCDDMTYANECMAIAAGVDVAAEGPC